jgi:hypothetical protein
MVLQLVVSFHVMAGEEGRSLAGQRRRALRTRRR